MMWSSLSSSLSCGGRGQPGVRGRTGIGRLGDDVRHLEVLHKIVPKDVEHVACADAELRSSGEHNRDGLPVLVVVIKHPGPVLGQLGTFEDILPCRLRHPVNVR